jgi:hypothetical protein
LEVLREKQNKILTGTTRIQNLLTVKSRNHFNSLAIYTQKKSRILRRATELKLKAKETYKMNQKKTVQSGTESHQKETIKRTKMKLGDFSSVSPRKTEMMLESAGIIHFRQKLGQELAFT